MYTQRHFISIAKMLNGLKPIKSDLETQESFEARMLQWESTVCKFIREFQQDSPKFKTSLFVKACEYQDK